MKRKTTQLLLPEHRPAQKPGRYDIFPAFPLRGDSIAAGYAGLATAIKKSGCVIMDGFAGVDWMEIREQLTAELKAIKVIPSWHDVSSALKPAAEIEKMVEPFLGGDDPLFGMRYTGELADFFDQTRLQNIRAAMRNQGLQIAYGCGAALIPGLPSKAEDVLYLYFDLPKNELQFRSRAGAVHSLGMRAPISPGAQYKRFFFVDWPVMNAHKAALLPCIDYMIDSQRPGRPAYCSGAALRETLITMSRNAFRARPWFEPGPWGGQWIRENIKELPKEVPNYAWSFELISPENGLLLEDEGKLLEISFDFLMFQAGPAVLGKSYERFHNNFPIRFDFLDTIKGGNLSLQCHPRPEYISSQFGEPFTQDETYYILECEPDASVYLGFRAGIDPEDFAQALNHSHANAEPLDVDRYVARWTVSRHDLFLIPNGTIHCSGAGALVLEISATPYIFTFKMYDWMRMDLDGRPRPLNIERALQNLYFDRAGSVVREELISRPSLIAEGAGWRRIHLPTHPQHFYDVHRYEITGEVEVFTLGSPHVLSLVEGSRIRLETSAGMIMHFNYAETFVVPAGADSYRLKSENGDLLKVVVAFIKP